MTDLTFGMMTDADTRRRRQAVKGRHALRALIQHGNPQAAAAALGIAETTLRRRVATYCELYGYDAPVQAAYHLDRAKDGDRMTA